MGNWTLRYRAVSTNNNDPEENVYGADGLFPRKGKAVVPGSLVEKVIKEKRPYFVRRITLLESREDDGLTAIARPLFISGEPAKVALVVVLFSNLKLLQPQIDRICPSEIYKFNKHL